MRRIIQSAVLVSLWALSGCAMQATGDESESVDANAEAITFSDVAVQGDLVLSNGDPSPPTPAATLVLYSEAGFYGDTLVQNAIPANNNEAVNLIRTTQIESANLYGRISSFRLVCGTRDAQVVLFADINNGATLHEWSEFSTGHAFSCKANQTLLVNLHQQAPEIADRVGSIYLVSHARQAVQVGFSAFVKSNWNNALADLPDGASADGDVQLKLDGSNSFVLRQFLTVDAWECEERGAIFGLRAIMNQDRTFQVSVNEVYVDTGWGDSWGCRDGMTDAVRAGAQDAANQLASGLHDLSMLAGNHPRYYFVPGFSMRDFDLVGGGDLPVKPVTKLPTKGAVLAR
ncbi:MAG TPA: hypothetical protein VG937_18390 [Polyangiaceae bacterium]|nr:hypothetical protein [Polyangiaceae bacterium]